MQHVSSSAVGRSAGVAVVALAALVVAACGSGSTAGTTGDGPELAITAPGDGESVGQPFTLTWESSVDLGPPDSGKDHVHVYVDGNENDYTVVGATEFEMRDLSAGEHEIEISLQHADHSDAGAHDSVTVEVSGGGGDGGQPSETSDSEPGPGGYGY